jgi:hypothetical protein
VIEIENSEANVFLVLSETEYCMFLCSYTATVLNKKIDQTGEKGDPPPPPIESFQFLFNLIKCHSQ